MQGLYRSALVAVQEAEGLGQETAYLMLKVPGHGLWDRAQVLPGVFGEFVSEEFSGGQPVTVVRVDARAVLLAADIAQQESVGPKNNPGRDRSKSIRR